MKEHESALIGTAQARLSPEVIHFLEHVMSSYDGVILGAGHNSLILQAYLGRAGLKTICLERRETYGGGLETIEYPAGSGFRHNIHSFYHRGLDRTPWYQELDLGRHGAEYLTPQLNVAMLCRDGRSLQWWTDFEKTVDSFTLFSRRDAATLRRWRQDFQPIVQQILIPESQAPPTPPDQRLAQLERTAEGRLLLEVGHLSPLEFVQREFEHPTVQAALLFFNGLREVDLRCPGMGHHIPALLASDRLAQMCRGGSQRLAEALANAVRHSGGEIRTDITPRQIVVENRRVRGVETSEGDFIEARQFVASSLNPQQTFVELIDGRHLPQSWIARARAFQYNLLAPLFSLNLNLRQPPRYQAAEEDPRLNDALMVILGLEHIDAFSDIVRHHEAGTIPPTVMWGSCPTQFDPSQAPEGQHTAFMWEKLPYHLYGNPNNWDAEKRRHAQQMLGVWSDYAPNLPDATLDCFSESPLDVERSLWNMAEGDLLVGAFSGGQVGYHRPFPGAGHYRGSLPGLYLCGSCCHPGGNITGLPGYNCSQVLLADLGLAG